MNMARLLFHRVVQQDHPEIAQQVSGHRNSHCYPLSHWFVVNVCYILLILFHIVPNILTEENLGSQDLQTTIPHRQYD